MIYYQHKQKNNSYYLYQKEKDEGSEWGTYDYDDDYYYSTSAFSCCCYGKSITHRARKRTHTPMYDLQKGTSKVQAQTKEIKYKKACKQRGKSKTFLLFYAVWCEGKQNHYPRANTISLFIISAAIHQC